MTHLIWQIGLLLTIATSLALLWSRYGVISIAGIAGIGFLVYSIPALIGLMTTPVTAGRFFLHTSGQATAMMMLAWIVFVGALYLLSLRTSFAGDRLPIAATLPGSEAHMSLSRLMWLALVASILIYFTLSWVSSPLFFLLPRDVAENILPGLQALWRWSIGIALLSAVIARNWLIVGLSILLTAIIFIIGDRTFIYISAFAIFISAFRGKPVGKLLRRPSIWILAIAMVFLVLFGKAAYLSIKESNWAYIEQFFQIRSHVQFFAGFEPLLIHGHLETVMFYDWTYPVAKTATAVFGQLLIVPSAFGIDSQGFSDAFTRTFYPGVNYGLAHSYWAQAYSTGGPLGIVLFAVIFGGLVALVDDWERRGNALTHVPVVLIGTTLAVYIFRNSLENILAFERQIAVAAIPLILAAKLMAPRLRRARSSVSAHTPARSVNG